jgi:hypothetical protein
LVYAFFLLAISFSQVRAQITRLDDPNQIGWFAVHAAVRLQAKWSANGEFQWRRDDWVKHPLQNLYRASINYQVHPAVSLRAGYAYAGTFPYGEPTLQAAGKTFPEHRSFQAVWINQEIGKVQLTHRFMLEQRWIGRFTSPALDKVDDYVYFNRMRYMARLQARLHKPAANGSFWYAAAFDEILIGFGKNIQQNVFDQNRVSALIGHQFSPRFRTEAGFLSQILQLGRRVEGLNVFQYNTGFTISSTFSFDARKKARP